jgi:hypothetical protein
MKAVGLYKHLPIEDPQSLVDLDIHQPQHPTGLYYSDRRNRKQLSMLNRSI